MVNVINAPDLFTLKDLILYYVSSSHFFFFLRKGKKAALHCADGGERELGQSL